MRTSVKTTTYPAVNGFGHRRFIRKIVQVLYHIQSQHHFQRVRLIPALSLAIARLYLSMPLRPRDDSLHLGQKPFFLRPHPRKFVAQGRQADLLIHSAIIPLFPFAAYWLLCGVALAGRSMHLLRSRLLCGGIFRNFYAKGIDFRIKIVYNAFRRVGL